MNAPKSKIATTIEELLEQIRQAASGGDYIFRGESNKKNSKVSSKLYRDYQAGIDLGHLDIQAMEKAIISEVGERTHEKDDNAILEQLQHYGGKTNQIDFSTDYLIALFFACYGEYKEDGRLILLNKEGMKTHKPATPQNRVIAQKSIFVHSSEGFVEPDDDKVIAVPSELKKNVLEYLHKYHNINPAVIYNDIHGYISQTAIHQDAYMCFYRGLTHQNKGEIDKSIKAYTESIERNPNMAEVYNNRSNAYSNKGEHDNAISDCTKAIELNPNYADAYYNRGSSYGDKGEHDNAISDFNKAIELNPNYASAYNNRGMGYNRKGYYDNAIFDFTKAIELDPNNAKAYNNRGYAYDDKDEPDLAIVDYTKAIELDPNYTNAYNNRANAYNRKGKHDDAIADCNKAIELNPDYVNAYKNRSVAKRELQEFEGAQEDFETALKLEKK